MKFFYKLILPFLMDLAHQKYPDKFAMSLWYLMKEAKNEVRELTALAGSNTSLSIYYKFNVLPLLNLFLSQYRIHTKPFHHLINFLCNKSLLLLL